MQLNLSLFQSKLSRRMYLMFIACALAPIALLAVVAYTHYTGQFKDRAFDLLHRTAKSQGMWIYEHLLSVENELQRVQFTFAGRLSHPNRQPQEAVAPVISIAGQKLRWLGIYRQQHLETLMGESDALPRVKKFLSRNLPSDSLLLRVLPATADSPAVVCMAQKLLSDHEPGGYLVGIINEEFLWGRQEGSLLPAGMEFCIWDQNGMIRNAPGISGDIRSYLSSSSTPAGSETLESSLFYAGRWEIFLKHRFQIPPWTVAVLKPKAQVLAPITRFNRYFLLIIGGVLVLALLSGSIMIRKNLVPIERLMEGVREIGQNRFGHRVQVSSRDEFEKLAQAFNHMSAQLEKQFKRLTLRADLDRTILSLLDTEKIVIAVLDRVQEFFPCRTSAITILEEATTRSGKTYLRPPAGGSVPVIAPCRLSESDERQLLEHNSRWLVVESESPPIEFLHPLQAEGVNQFIILPVWVQQHIFAIVSFGLQQSTVYDADDLQQARQLANQLAIAFSNANLISELKALNLGALNALARTVDAKSSWTAGHSARVMRTCLDIGRSMGLSSKAMDDLHRAALLHDIGKIGVPIQILNKPAALTPQEQEVIQSHLSIGARILSPIKAYEQLLPIIHQHHERFDGKGYPLGLRGNEIHQSARILAVADTYDALVSDRPYRHGMAAEQAVEVIKQLAGSQLDPDVVEFFVQLYNGGKIHSSPQGQIDAN